MQQYFTTFDKSHQSNDKFTSGLNVTNEWSHVSIQMKTYTKPLSVLCCAWGGCLARVSVDAIGSIQLSII